MIRVFFLLFSVRLTLYSFPVFFFFFDLNTRLIPTRFKKHTVYVYTSCYMVRIRVLLFFCRNEIFFVADSQTRSYDQIIIAETIIIIPCPVND